MKKMTYLSKMMCVVAILLASNLWTNAQDAARDGTNDNVMYLMLDHYESDFVASEGLNYYRNFLTLANPDPANALTVERVANGENGFTLYRYDAERPEILVAVADLNLATALQQDRVMYAIDYEDDTQMHLPADNITVPTQGYLAVNDGIIDMDGIMFMDRFTADVSNNLHPNRYGYVLKSNVEEKSTNVVIVPVMKVDATIDGIYTHDQVMEDVDASLVAGVKNANVEMVLESQPRIYYYTLQRGDNDAPNELISRLQRRTDGTFMEMYDFLPDEFGLEYDPGVINRHDTNLITGQYGDFMNYQATVWTFGFDRLYSDDNFINNSYGSPILKTGVADLGLSVNGSAGMGPRWRDEDGNQCMIYNPIIYMQAEMPDYASVEYEPYMYRVWRLCESIRNYQMDPGGFPVNDETAPRETFKLVAEVQDNSTSIVVGSEYGQELAFGSLAYSDYGQIQFRVRVYYKKVTEGIEEEDKPMYYVVEKLVPWDYIYFHTIEGDANGDGNVDVQDVTDLIDYLLGNPIFIDMSSVDMNGDHTIDVADLTMLIDWILIMN